MRLIPPDLLDILACPRCDDRPKLELKEDKLVCPSCGCSYPIVDGVPHLLPEDAEPPRG
ncbi:MAG: Trm112 family protein [Armatimonadetes bacterium]|nr:Trm112 family protein [Armatimonadota bacterium]